MEKQELPYMPARVLLRDFTGVPCVVDLAALRSAMERAGKPADRIEPLIPVDLVIDHSVQLDDAGNAASFKLNVDREFERNEERYKFFDGVNKPLISCAYFHWLRYLSSDQYGVSCGLCDVEWGWRSLSRYLSGNRFADYTINCMGVLDLGGGIEAEAAMLGQPIRFLRLKLSGLN